QSPPWIGLFAMRDRVTEALKDHGARYVEIRLEQTQGTHLRYRGRELEDVGRTSGIGGNVRALAGGGWGFACFNDLSQLKEKVVTAVSHARQVGGEPVSLAVVEPHVDIVSPTKHACANWQYVVNGTYPPIGTDKYILSAGDDLYFYFGNPRRVLLSSPSVQTATSLKVKAENYDYVNNAWTVLSGATIGATQTNPDDPYSPLVISSVTSDENGFADLVLGISGSYSIGLAMDYYFPAESLSVLEPIPPEGSNPEANYRARSQIQKIETVMTPSQSERIETVAENKTLEEITKLPVTNETKKAEEIIIEMDISMDNFIEKYNIALQNQKFQAREESRSKATNESLMVYNDKNLGENQLAGVAVALKPRETWIKKVFSKISDFLKFRFLEI
ncbi:MAG: DNA gyrase modulator, partial [bacterium]|nr:DNA gyrase modulator [bacterium]